MTRSERMLWVVVRGRRFHGLKFRRQHSIGPFVADFFCDDFDLVVEVDGAAHQDAQQAVRDEQRSEALRSLGYHVLRLQASEVESDPLAALEAHYPFPPLSPEKNRRLR